MRVADLCSDSSIYPHTFDARLPEVSVRERCVAVWVSLDLIKRNENEERFVKEFEVEVSSLLPSSIKRES